MLEILGGHRTYCDGVGRREFLKVGALGLGGISLPTLLQARAAGAAGAAPKAKRVLLLWMGGGPSHFETFDPKPDAPEGYRGPSRAIPTNVPGIRIHEWLPRMAKLADRYAIIRSISHGDQGHNSADHWMQTGHPSGPIDSAGMATQLAPYFGTVIARLQGGQRSLPANVSIRTFGTYGIGGFNTIYHDRPERLGPAYMPLRMTGSEQTGYVLNDLPLPAGVTP